VDTTDTHRNTYVPGAVLSNMELQAALTENLSKPPTPYNADSFEDALRQSGLTALYPNLVPGLRYGFLIGIPHITHRFTPDNSRSLLKHASDFSTIIATELELRRWIGPLSLKQLTRLYPKGFHISPCSILPKPHNPLKKRLIQNFSYPHSLSADVPSINSQIEISDFPCTWGLPSAVAWIINTLPEGSQISVRDVTAAYRSIPLHPSQTAGTVIRLTEDTFASD
jgi:hypothetical protein